MTNTDVEGVIKGELLIHDVYGPVFFETMTLKGACVVRVFSTDQEKLHSGKHEAASQPSDRGGQTAYF